MFLTWTLSRNAQFFDECDPSITLWTNDGTMIKIKDQDWFEKEMISKHFSHSKFLSFAQKLKFYGFQKIPPHDLWKNGHKEDRNNKGSGSSSPLSVVTFHNKFFKQGRHDLLKNIQRSTKTQNNTSHTDQQEEIESLKNQINKLVQEMLNIEHMFKEQITNIKWSFNDELRKCEKNPLLEFQ